MHELLSLDVLNRLPFECGVQCAVLMVFDKALSLFMIKLYFPPNFRHKQAFIVVVVVVLDKDLKMESSVVG